jgi:hypothetical protein
LAALVTLPFQTMRSMVRVVRVTELISSCSEGLNAAACDSRPCIRAGSTSDSDCAPWLRKARSTGIISCAFQPAGPG